MITVRFTRLDESVSIPTRAREGDAAWDLACLERFTLYPHMQYVARTGLRVEIPPGYAGFILPRSGLAVRDGITIPNSPGLIDSGYRGEVLVGLVNNTNGRHEFAECTRIAQLVIQRVPEVEFVEVAELAPSARGAGGFGSSGR